MFRGYMTKLKYIFLSFFTNQEDPVPPEWFKPDIENIYIRKIFWWFRNPAHNFFWRVIGIVDEIYLLLHISKRERRNILSHIGGKG